MKFLRLVVFGTTCLIILWYISGKRSLKDPSQQSLAVNYEADYAPKKKSTVERAVESANVVIPTPAR